MASRAFMDKQYVLQKRQTTLWGNFSVGGAGAVTLQTYNFPAFGTGVNARTYTAAPTTGGGSGFPSRYAQGSEGIFSVARTGTGLWTVTLQDQYQRILNMTVSSSLAGGAATIVAIAENTTITNMSATGGSIIGVALLSATATLADPASGNIIRIRFDLADATEP